MRVRAVAVALAIAVATAAARSVVVAATVTVPFAAARLVAVDLCFRTYAGIKGKPQFDVIVLSICHCWPHPPE